MRPALKASRPASTASFMAVAIATGSLAPAMAVFIRTPSQPELHGDRRVRRRAYPGVHDHGHGHRLEDELDVVRIPDAEPRADRGAQRHHRGGAGILELLRHHRIVVRVGQHRKPSRASVRVASSSPSASGNSVRESPITSSFTSVAEPRLAGQVAVLTASSAV